MSCRILKCLDFKCNVASPLLDFVQELSENRASEVAGQTPRHIVFDEGFNHSLSEEESAGLAFQKVMNTLKSHSICYLLFAYSLHRYK